MTELRNDEKALREHPPKKSEAMPPKQILLNPGTYAPQRGNPVKKNRSNAFVTFVPLCETITGKRSLSVIPLFRHSVIPSFRYSVIPLSVTPSFRYSVIPLSVIPLSVTPSLRHSVIPLSVIPSFRYSVIPLSVIPKFQIHNFEFLY